jgi:hypothetical protein
MKLVGPALEAAMKQASKQVKACLNCFVAGTLVATACGLVPIEEVQAGDWVWARDEVTGEVRLCEVEETYRNQSPVILEVTVGGETVATTPGHPFWVLDHGWKDAGELEVGDHLVNLRGESVVVEDIRRRPVPEAVYNFSVAGLHTYFVGQGGIWVHNASGPGCGVGANSGSKTHVTYTKPGPNGEMYSGRSSGPSRMTPEEIVARRDAGHHMNDKDFGPAMLDKSSSNGAAIRGREQQLIEANGGAQSTGGTSGNAINGISPTNKKGSDYRSEADLEFGGG